MARVLIADDEKSIRVTLGAFLEGAGHTVMLADGAESALELLDDADIDVAVLDILLGRVTGLVVARHIREAQPNAQIILITGEPGVTSAREAIRLRVFDYLDKPLGKAEIIEIVARAAHEKVRRDAMDRQEADREAYRAQLEKEVAEKTADIIRREERFNRAMEASRDGLFDWDLVTNGIYFSPGWKRMLGYEDDELPNAFSVWESLTDAEDVERCWAMQQDLLAGKVDRFQTEFRMRHKDGHWVHILARADAVRDEEGNAVRIVGTHVDISDRKRVEMALRQSEALHRQAQRVARIGHWQLDAHDAAPQLSDEFFLIFGLAPGSDAPPFPEVSALVHPDDWPALDRAVRLGFGEGRGYDLVIRVFTPEHATSWIHVIGGAEKDADGNVLRLFGTAQDITQLKEAEQALASSERRFRDVLDRSPFPVAVVDAEDDRVFFWSKSATELFGHTPGTAAEWSALAYPDPEYLEEVLAQWEPAVERARQTERAVNAGEYRVRCADGRTIICEIHAQFVDDRLIVTLNDVTRFVGGERPPG